MATVMLYKYPGKHKIHGDMFDYTIVKDGEEVEKCLKDGWCRTTGEAKNTKSDTKPKDEVESDNERDRLIQEAKDLGIDFHPNIGIGKLKKRIEEVKVG